MRSSWLLRVGSTRRLAAVRTGKCEIGTRQTPAVSGQYSGEKVDHAVVRPALDLRTPMMRV